MKSRENIPVSPSAERWSWGRSKTSCSALSRTDRTQLIQSGKKAAHLSDVHRNIPGGPTKDCHTQNAKMVRREEINSKGYEVNMLKVLSNLVMN